MEFKETCIKWNILAVSYTMAHSLNANTLVVVIKRLRRQACRMLTAPRASSLMSVTESSQVRAKEVKERAGELTMNN